MGKRAETIITGGSHECGRQLPASNSQLPRESFEQRPYLSRRWFDDSRWELGVGGWELNLPLLQRQNLLRIGRPDVVSPGPDEPVVLVLLQAVRGPARDAAHGEDRRIQIDRDPEGVIRGRRIEIHVRVELLLAGDELFNPFGHLEPAAIAGPLAELLRHAAQMRRARIFGAIHPVPEAGN